MERYSRYILGLLVFFIVFLGFDAYYKFKTFKQYHQKLSHKTLVSTASEIDIMLVSLRRILKLFVTQEHQLLSSLYLDPTHSVNKQRLEQKIKDYFPEHIEYTLTDNQGKIILNPQVFDAYAQCREEIKRVSNTGVQALNTHNFDDPLKQHYDVMQSFTVLPHKKAIFFISYSIEPLKRLMNHRQIEHHLLFAVNTQQQDQIEFIDDKSLQRLQQSEIANHLNSLDVKRYKMSRDEIKTNQPIKGTNWMLVDIVDPQYLKQTLLNMLIQHSVLFVLFLLVSFFFIRAIRQEVNNSINTHMLLKGVENERKRISMEMHDCILADITHLSRKIDVSIQLNKKQINDQLQGIAKSIRGSIEDLHPNSLDLLGIEAALLSYINKHLTGEKFPDYTIKILPEAEHGFRAYEKYNLFRILVELVNNIINHAQCSHYVISSLMDNNKIEFRVEDNGVGRQNKAGQQVGHGLNNIKSRCQMLGATFSRVEKLPHGTVISITIAKK